MSDKSELEKAYERGYRDGMVVYAWRKNGVQYVGTTGTTLAEAIKNINKHYNYLYSTEKIGR